jgi:hypothetical protein
MAIALSIEDARTFLLRKHGLLDYKFESITDYVKMVGCVQYDPVDVCGKNAELVFQSRIAGFTKAGLYDELYSKRTLVEHFDKNMAMYLTTDWPKFSRIRVRHQNAAYEVQDLKDAVLKIVSEKKICTPKDLDLTGKIPWNWQHTSRAKAVLEMLYFQGEIGIHHRMRTIRYYSPIQTLIDSQILAETDPNSTDHEFIKWMMLRRIKSVGLLWNRPSDAFLAIPGLKTEARNRIFSELLASGQILEVNIREIKWPLYLPAEDESLLISSKGFQPKEVRMEFLAPLDNLIWDRKLIKALFGFDYTWEIYSIESKRKYGYYVLPILEEAAFVGRIELANDQKTKTLILKNIWWEESVVPTLERMARLDECLKRFRDFSEADTLTILDNAKKTIAIK